VISNDDNGNGVLEAGETADLGVVLNNSGSEIAVNLSGILSSTSEFITIVDNNAEFASIAPDASATAYFKVTLSNNATGNLDIPFELEVKDKYNEATNISFDYISSCDIIYTLRDDFGDGWMGAKIIASYSDNSESDTYTLTNGEAGTFTKTLNTGVEVSLEWKKGSTDSECKYTINYENAFKTIDSWAAMILEVEGTGDIVRAENYSKKNGQIRPSLQETLDVINGKNIPKDIRYEQGKKVLGL
jgi:hypothetical protein